MPDSQDLFTQATELVELGRLDEALALDPNDPDAQANREIALQKQSQGQEIKPVVTQSPNPSSSGNWVNDWFNNFLNPITNLMKNIFPSSSNPKEGSVDNNPPQPIQPSHPVPTIYPNPTITIQPYHPPPTVYPTPNFPINPAPSITINPIPRITYVTAPRITIQPYRPAPLPPIQPYRPPTRY